VLRLRGGIVLLQSKILQGRSRNEGGGEEGQVSGHKLNVTDGLTDEIILTITPSAILFVSMPRYRVISLIKSQCNTVYNVIGIFTDELYR